MLSVVVVVFRRLNQRDAGRVQLFENVHGNQIAYNSRSNHKGHKKDEHGEVENGVTEHTLAPELGLLHRVDGRTDLTAVKKLATAQDTHKWDDKV